MSKLSTFLRSVTRGRWPRSRKVGPEFCKWKRLGHSPDRRARGDAARSAADLKIEHFFAAPVYFDRLDHLYHSLRRAPAHGHVMEFGVLRAGSLNWLAKWCSGRPETTVFGFDSFDGLPEDWIVGADGRVVTAKKFAVKALPEVLPNVELVPGWFDATLPAWLAANPGPVALLHNDSDLYSSTIYTLRSLNDRLIPGSIIVFDELCDWQESGAYENWEAGEWKALLEWMHEFKRTVRVISRHERMAATVEVVS